MVSAAELIKQWNEQPRDSPTWEAGSKMLPLIDKLLYKSHSKEFSSTDTVKFFKRAPKCSDVLIDLTAKK